MDLPTLKRFQQHFTTFREDKVLSEQSFYDTAILIGNYIEKKHLAAMQKELTNKDSEAYRQFEVHGHRTMGAVLYGVLALMDYRDQATLQEEDKILHDGERVPSEEVIINQLCELVANLYANPTHAPKTTSEQITKLITLWLHHYALDSDDSNQAQRLCSGLYAVFKILEIKSTTLNIGVRTTLSGLGINLEECQRNISTTLNKLHSTYDKLDILTREKPSLLPGVQSITEQFDTIYTLLIQDVPKNKSGLELIHDTLTEDIERISSMIQLRQQRQNLSEQLSQVRQFKRVIEQNEAQITGRLYAHDLIKDNRELFNAILQFADKTTQQHWRDCVRELEHPDTIRWLTGGIQYGVSTLTFLPTVLYRVFVPTFIQQRIQNITPITYDRHIKDNLMELMRTREQELIREMQTIQEDLDAQLNNLTERFEDEVERQDVTDGLNSLSIKGLEQWKAILVTRKELIIQYIALHDKLTNNQSKLDEIESIQEHINAFIEHHNGFWVWLSNLLSRIWSVFKSDTAKKIDEVLIIKAELNALEDAYQGEIESQKHIVLEHEGATKSYIDNLDALLPEAEKPAARKYMVDNIHHSFSTIQTQHKRLHEDREREEHVPQEAQRI